jgi:hypothetical protein
MMDCRIIVRPAYCVLLHISGTDPGWREVTPMERIIFLLVILGGLYWLMRRIHNSWSARSPRRPVAGSKDYSSSAGSASLHATPGNNLLADNQKIWKARCQHMVEAGSEVTGSNAPQGFEAEPAYDGYSRSDRHHLTPAHIKKEQHIDGLSGLTKPNVKFKPPKSKVAAKSHKRDQRVKQGQGTMPQAS